MNTSYFAKYKGENAVSIAGKCPKWYTGRQYKKLAPKYNWWKKWHDEKLSEEWYIEQYYKTILNKLDAKKVYEELGKNAVLLCWEKSGKFCHRHLVAEWFQKELGIEVNELK